jgi:site-specific DNA-methyltransferase (adenine-specific)
MNPNRRQKMDGLALLRRLDAGAARLVFFDPQYRGVLDRQAYGNEGERQRARSKLRQMSEAKIAEFIGEIGRVLGRSGHLMLWLDKFSIGEGIHLRVMTAAPQLERVDLIHWNKMNFGMGKRARGVSEYLVVMQHPPIRAKGIWTDHRIRDSWPEKFTRGVHPHAKPIGLTKRLIEATSRPGDLVVDPAAGGYVVLKACQATGREFMGCDIGR